MPDDSFAFGSVEHEGQARPYAFRVLGNGITRGLQLPGADAVGWLAVASTWVGGPRFRWKHEGLGVPAQLLSALTIAGRCDGHLCWTLSDAAVTGISAWLGSDYDAQ